MLKLFSILFICSLLIPVIASGQDFMDIQQRQNLRKHALDNIEGFENLLNEIISSNNPEEKKIMLRNSFETDIYEKANIEDDLNPDKATSGLSEYVSVQSYLELFPFYFIPDGSQKPVTFSNIYISNIHTDEYTYITVYFECLFSGKHKHNSLEYKKVKRLATIRVFNYEGKQLTKIVNIKFSNNSELSKVKKEALSFERELQEFVDSENYRQKLADKEYNFYIEEGDIEFSKKEYILAKDKYRKALQARADDLYAANQISECEKKIEQIEKDKLFEQLIKEGDEEFALGRYYSAKSKFESAERLRNNDSHVKHMLSRIERKTNTRYPNKTTAYLGLNYNFSETAIDWSTTGKTFEDGIKNDFSIERLGISFYYPVGFYVSGIKTWDEKEPDYHYSFEDVNFVRNDLINSNTDFTDLTFVRKGEHIGAFNFGVYLSFFRPFYFKLGMKQRFGSQWDLYSGDFKGKINYANKSKLYAVNYKTTNPTDFQAGFAVVVPYGQIEATYDNYNQSIQISAGFNYPFRNVYFLKKNPNKWRKEKSYKSDDDKRFPYKKTFYIALSYDFLNFYPDVSSDFQLESLADISFADPLSEKFSLSMFYKLGFFVSGYRQTNDKEPDYYYSSTDITQKRNSLVASQTSFTELVYVSTQGNYTKFNLGMSLCFFRPLHFKFGASFAIGSSWDVYSGDYKGYMIKFNRTNYYAVDYKDYIKSEFVGGIALVFPYAQIEIMYDGFYNKYSLSAGLNIPIVKK